MTVALEPSMFAGGDAPPGGGETWDLVGIDAQFRQNPRRLVGAVEREWVSLWALCRPGMGGARLLPDAGGVLDQAALTMEGIAIMDDQAAKAAPTKDSTRKHG